LGSYITDREKEKRTPFFFSHTVVTSLLLRVYVLTLVFDFFILFYGHEDWAHNQGVDSVSYKLVKITKMSEFTGIYIISLVNT